MLFLNVKDYEVFEFTLKRSKSGYFPAMTQGNDSKSPRNRQDSIGDIRRQSFTSGLLDGYDSDSTSSSDESLSAGENEDHLGARTKVLRLLCDDRLDELDTDSKVVLIDALMKLGLQAHKMNEQWLWNIIRSTEAEELMRLKNLMDATGTYHTLFKLVNHDIHNERVLKMVKAHITREATVVRSRRLWRSLGECYRRMNMMPKDILDMPETKGLIGLAKRIVESRKHKSLVSPTHACGSGSLSLSCLKVLSDHSTVPLALLTYVMQVLSDLDDTLYSSGGDGIGGVDPRLAKHTLYPGVLTFLRELDIGITGQTGHTLGNLVFLSARPHIYKNMSESLSYSLFERLQREHELHCSPTLLPGELRSSLTNTGIAEKKLENYLGCSHPHL